MNNKIFDKEYLKKITEDIFLDEENDILDEEGLIGTIAKKAVGVAKSEVPMAAGMTGAGMALNAAMERKSKVAQGIREQKTKIFKGDYHNIIKGLEKELKETLEKIDKITGDELRSIVQKTRTAQSRRSDHKITPEEFKHLKNRTNDTIAARNRLKKEAHEEFERKKKAAEKEHHIKTGATAGQIATRVGLAGAAGAGLLATGKHFLDKREKQLLKKKKIKQIAGAVGAGAALTGAGALYKQHQKRKEAEKKISEDKRENIKMDKLQETIIKIRKEIVLEIELKEFEKIREGFQVIHELEAVNNRVRSLFSSIYSRLEHKLDVGYVSKMRALKARAAAEPNNETVKSEIEKLKSEYESKKSQYQADYKELSDKTPTIVSWLMKGATGGAAGGAAVLTFLNRNPLGRYAKAGLSHLGLELKSSGAGGEVADKAGAAFEKAKAMAKAHPVAAGAAAGASVLAAKKLMDQKER